jgi:hypothetical protein
MSHTHDQNGQPIHRWVSQNPIDDLWYTTVWEGSQNVFNVRRYGYRTRAEARDGHIGDFKAASYQEPGYEDDRAYCSWEMGA